MSSVDPTQNSCYGSKFGSVNPKHHQIMSNLELLQHLLKRGFLTDAEYEERRRQLVDQLTNTTLSTNSLPISAPSELLPTCFLESSALSPQNENALISPFINIQVTKASPSEKCEDSTLSPHSESLIDLMDVETNTTTDPLLPDRLHSTNATEPVVPCRPPTYPEMSFQEKHALCEKILNLHSGALQRILCIVHEEEPLRLEKQSDEWSFDLGFLSPKTLWLLKNYVDSISKEPQNSSSTTPTSTINSTSNSTPSHLSSSSSYASSSFSTTTTTTTTTSSSSSSSNSSSFSSSNSSSTPLEETIFSTRTFSTSPIVNATGAPILTSTPLSPSSDDSNPFSFTCNLPNVSECSLPDCATLTTEIDLPQNLEERNRKRKHLRILPESQSPPNNEIVKKSKYDLVENKSELKTNETLNSNNSMSSSFNETNQPFTVKITIIDTRQVKTPDGSYRCPECSNIFTNRSNLMKHLRIHTQEKPYVCNLCNKAFAYPNSLKEHMNTHEKKISYVCPYCQKAFSNGSNLTRHLRIHTGEKPYICQYCNRGFTQSNNLKSHMRKHMKS